VASAMDRLISDPTLAAALADSAHAEVAQRRFGPVGTRLAYFLEACLEGRRALNQRRLSSVVKALFR
ncbi:MAG: hypothetical protein K8R59_16195, partial [Thermoanaerobaculales bacterium]|nr:hypothetical protein [Thermoanaerobaculales bacterium]